MAGSGRPNQKQSPPLKSSYTDLHIFGGRLLLVIFFRELRLCTLLIVIFVLLVLC